MHGNIWGYSYEDNAETDNNGMARLYTYIQQVRAENPNTFLVDAGDDIQGTIMTDDLYNKTPEEPHPVVTAMNYMGYDAMTLGNHEFNWGIPTMQSILGQASFPVLAANVTGAQGEPVTGAGWTIVERGGVKLAVIGVVTPDVPIWDSGKDGIDDAVYEAANVAVGKAIDEIGDQADVIMVSAHMGMYAEFDEEGGSDSAQKILDANPENDVLQVAHNHVVVNEKQGSTVIGGVRIPTGNGQTVRLRQGASLADLAEKINVNQAALVTVLFHLGEMATATQSLDEATFQILGEEIGWNIKIVSAEEEDKELLQQFDINLDEEELQEDEDLKPRPPVVTVMGHVDHGKTRLLDTIRRTNVIEGEAGGITQRIGAYQVTVNLEGEPRKITFLDTPGHEAFTAMRARGAELTDVAILVVAADDGVMPQTVEAINHAQAAHVPIVVAVNKIDKPGANPDKVRGQLTEYGLVPEEYGGNTMFVDISAKQGTNVDKLLEAVLLTADAELDLRANPDMDARGATVEARLDKGRGAVATVLVQSGTLHIGDAIVAGTSYGRVRAMLDENGNHMQEAGPSTPVQVLGLTSVPTAGDLFLVASDDRTARQIAEKRQATERAAQLAKRRKVVSLESLKEQFAKSEVDMLNIVIKGDSSGSVEALEDSLMKIEVSDEVGIQVIHRGVGAITQNDVNLATVDKAVIIGFYVRPNRQVADLAEREGVEIKYYSVIYRAIEDIEASLKGMLKPEYEEVVTSHSEIREIFRSSKFGNIAGVMVQDGEVKRGTKCRILRNGVATVNDLEISSLRRFKDDEQSVKEGYEAGINLGTFNDIELGDIIETFEMQEVERK